MRNLLPLVILLLTGLFANAQDNSISGKLLENGSEKEPIVFGKVTIKETEQSMLTDYKGQYFFENLKPGKYTLVYTFLGYTTQTKEVIITNNKNIYVDTTLTQSIAANFSDMDIITTSIAE